MTIGFAPGVEIYREFGQATTPRGSRLPAYVFGPAADVYTSNVLGTYDDDPTTEVDSILRNAYSYPAKRVGGTVDLSTVSLSVKNGLFRYFQDTTGLAVKKARNVLQLPSYILKTGNSYSVSSAVGARGVMVGDPVQVRATISAVDHVINTYVTRISGDPTAASVGAVTAGSANAVDHVSAPTSTITAVVNGAVAANTDMPVAATITGYNGTKDGRLSETYTVTVLVGGELGVVNGVQFEITSADGKDNRIMTAAGGGVVYLGSRGAQLTFTPDVSDQFTVGQRWVVVVHSQYVAPTVTVTGTYTGTKNNTYIIEAVSGGEFADSPVIRVVTQDGSDASGPFTVEVDSGDESLTYALGSYGLSVSFDMEDGLVTGDRWTVVATAAGEAQLRRVHLAHSLPDAMVVDTATYDTEIDFMVRRDLTIPQQLGGTDLWTARANDVLVEAGITYEWPDITETNGDARAIPLVLPAGITADNQLQISYRVWHPRSTSLLSMAYNTNLDTSLDGPTSVDNPLKLALSFAQGEASGVPVLYFCVGDPSIEANWEAALQIVDQVRSVYGLVPLTDNPTILSLVNAHCVSRSTPILKLHRVFWAAPNVPTAITIDGDVDTLLATIADDSNTAGTQYTLVQFSAGHIDLLTAGVRAGDVLRYGYGLDAYGNETYFTAVIDSVVNADSLLLATGAAAAEPIARKVEIHRTLSTAELVAQLQSTVTAYGEKARVLMPNFVSGAQTIPGYILAAAFAARRSAYLPHRPMTNTEVNGITGLNWETRFTADDLNSLAEAGYFLLKQNPATGQITIRHAITAGDYANVLIREESIQSNYDDLLFQIDDQLTPLYGKLNANAETLNRITIELESLANRLLGEGINSVYGAQIISMEVVDVRIAVGSKDTVVVVLTLEGPAPANRIQVFMYAN